MLLSKNLPRQTPAATAAGRLAELARVDAATRLLALVRQAAPERFDEAADLIDTLAGSAAA